MNKCIDGKKTIGKSAVRCMRCASIHRYIKYPYLKEVVRLNLISDTKGKKNGMFGKTHTEKIKKSMRKRQKGKDNIMFGKKHTTETIIKMRLKKLGKRLTVKHKINIGLILIAIFVVGVVNAFAGGVTDNNNGNLGDILVSTGQNNGANSVGTWTDSSFLKGEKGDKGDKGDKGAKGDKGVKGDKGDRGKIGKTGKAGYTPIKNKDYFDGINGTNGENGKDIDPEVVNNLQKEDINLKNNINSVNSRVDDLSKRVDRLEKTQVVAELGVRVYDSKYLSVIPYIQQNFTRAKVSEVGVKFLFKIGKSYEEKLIDNQSRRLAEIEKRVGVAPVIEKVVNEKGKTKSIRIIENGLAIDSQF